MRLTFRDMTKEINVFNLEKQSCKIKEQMFEVNFIENNYEEESKRIENETLFLDELFEDKCDYINEKTHIGDPNLESPLKIFFLI